METVKTHPMSGDGGDDADRPNITIDDDKEVHLNVSDHAGSDEGSIVAAPQRDYPIDADLDPKISHVPQQKAGNVQSKCCLLL
jgi:hypothetical protein